LIIVPVPKSHWNVESKRLIAAGRNRPPTSPKVEINSWLLSDPLDTPGSVTPLGE